jgi:hypothetical protein
MDCLPSSYFTDYPPGYFPDPSKKLGMQPDLTANTSSTNNSNVGLLFPEYTYPGSNASSGNKDNLPLTPGRHLLITWGKTQYK